MSREDGGLDLKPHVYNRVRTMIDSGLYTKKDVFDYIAQECSNSEAPVLAAEQPKLRGYAAKRWTQHENEEKGWTDYTVNDRIDAAFRALEASGIVALQNAGWTMTTGWEDSWDAYRERRKNGEFARGAVFYHSQDLDRGVAGEGLMLAFGIFAHTDDADPAGNAAIATEACEVLRAHGIDVKWEGSPFSRIEISPFVWRKRRFTTPPEVPLPPQPWRRFLHPDGREWQVRLSGRDVEIYIEMGDGEPIERRRTHATRAAAEKSHAELISQQLENGFIEHSSAAQTASEK